MPDAKLFPIADFPVILPSRGTSLMRRTVVARLLSFMLLTAALGLAACATPLPSYRAADRDGAIGWSEQSLEPNRWRVSFQGGNRDDLEEVEDAVLLRAAELTLDKGFDHFVLSDRKTDARTRFVGGPSRFGRYDPFFDYYYFRRGFGWRGFYDPFFSRYDPFNEVDEVKRYRAVAEVAMFRGPKPDGDAKAFDARALVGTLTPRVRRSTGPAPPA
jgi:hypothetical protein